MMNGGMVVMNRDEISGYDGTGFAVKMRDYFTGVLSDVV